MASMSASDAASKGFNVALAPARGVHRIIRWIIGIIIFIVCFLIGTLVYAAVFSGSQSGLLGSQIKHTAAGVEEPAKGILGTIRGVPLIRNTFGFLINPESSVVSFESDVQSNTNNKDLGVRIIEFDNPQKLIRPGDDILFRGKIRASSLSEEIKVKVSCKMEDYKGTPIVEVLGSRASENENEVIVYKNENTLINFNCEFPGGIALDNSNKPIESRYVTAVVTYEFANNAFQKLYFLPPNVKDDLDRSGINPFKYYKISDSQLKSDGTIKSVSTPGPINLGIGLSSTQPLTSNSGNSNYELFVELSNNPEFSGNLESVNKLEIQVPDVQQLNIALQGEEGFKGRTSVCDFQYVGVTDDGFKTYELIPERISEINTPCDQPFKDFSISEKQCINLFKSNPYFSCKFVVNKVPDYSGLQFDTIRSTINYVYKIEKRSVVDIRKTKDIASLESK